MELHIQSVRRTFDEQNLGLPLENALQNFAKRVPLLEVHFFVSAVLLQKLLASVQEFAASAAQSDDVTALVLKYRRLS